MSDPKKNDSVVIEEERPPVFRTWNQLYGVVLGNLMLLIGLFYLITRHFA